MILRYQNIDIYHEDEEDNTFLWDSSKSRFLLLILQLEITWVLTDD